MNPNRRQQGMTLVEVVIAIVIIAIAVTAVLGVFARNIENSADALVIRQGISIANAYLEEVSLKPFTDPDGIDGEGLRQNFDDVDDYNGLVDNGATDQFGNAIAGLEAYTVSVAVGASSALPNVASADALRIDVRVSYPPQMDFTISGYRTRL